MPYAYCGAMFSARLGFPTIPKETPMPTLRKASALALFSLFSAAALASPAMDKLTVTPAAGAKVGDKVTATVEMSGEPGMCGLEVDFGDGRRERIKVEPATKFPIVVEHSYKKAREYKVRADGHVVNGALGCPGRHLAVYKVEAAPPPAPVTPASLCPENWALQGKAAKDGSFTCIPAKGVKEAKKPEKMLECPAGTSYFTKGKTLGCEKG